MSVLYKKGGLRQRTGLLLLKSAENSSRSMHEHTLEIHTKWNVE
jgi:hypothetical protein